MMKTLLLGLAATGVLLGCAIPAFGDSSGAVAAHVQVASPCIIVTPSSVDFGTVRFVSAGGNGGVSQPYQIDPCGMQERILVRGTPATSDPVGAIWQLGSLLSNCPQPNVYSTRVTASLGNIARNIALSTTDSLLVIAGGSRLSGLLVLNPPCEGSDGAGRLMNFSYIFTATF
jgi:hypothetical protein